MSNSGRGGHIVITASVSGLFAGAGAGVYATSKFALVGLAESLRADLRASGVGVSVLCPGPVKSELFESTQQVRPAPLAASGSVPVVPQRHRCAPTRPYSAPPRAAQRSGRTYLRVCGATTSTSSRMRRYVPCSRRAPPRCCARCPWRASARSASRPSRGCSTHRCTRRRPFPGHRQQAEFSRSRDAGAARAATCSDSLRSGSILRPRNADL